MPCFPRLLHRLGPLAPALMLCLGPGPARAADTPPAVPVVAPAPPAAPADGTGWPAALAAAWARHPGAAALPERQAESRARHDAARSLTAGPASASLARVDDRPGSRQGRREWELELAAPLWRPGQRPQRQQLAEAADADQQARTALTRWQLAGELREAWWAVAQARGEETLAARRREQADALHADLRRRLAAGEVPRTEAHLAATEALAAADAQDDVRQARRQAEDDYQALTGQPAPDILAPEPAAPEPPVDAHPALQAALAAAALARQQVADQAAAGAGQPELALRWLHERDGSGQPAAQALGLKLTVPFGGAAPRQQDAAAARAELRHADTELQRTRERLQRQRQQAAGALSLAETQQARARTRLALAQDTATLTERAHRLGEADLPALLRARISLHEAQAGLQRLDTTVALARSRQLQAWGLLP